MVKIVEEKTSRIFKTIVNPFMKEKFFCQEDDRLNFKQRSQRNRRRRLRRGRRPSSDGSQDDPKGADENSSREITPKGDGNGKID